MAGDLFGISTSVSGDTVVVGALKASNAGGTYAGSAYVFVRTGTAWSQQAHLLASDGAAGDLFGASVAVTGDTAVVGAGRDDTPGGIDAGSAYAFQRSGVTWTERAPIVASGGAGGDIFGCSIAISGDTVVVGAIRDDNAGGTDAGAAYVFTCTPGAAPACSAGGPYASQCDGVMLSSATATDPDGDPLTHFWESDCDADGAFGEPGDGSFEDPTVLNTVFHVPDPCGSTCTVRLTTDDGGATCLSTTTVTVDDTTPPTLAGVPASGSAECGAVPPPAPVTATDNCGPVTPVFTEQSFPASVGCSDGQREGYVDVGLYPNVAGCSGGWSVPGVLTTLAPSCNFGAGDDGTNPSGLDCDVADVCAPGWHVAATPAEVAAALGGAPVAETGMPTGLFFVTRQSGTGCGHCATGTTPGCTGASCAGGCLQTLVTSNDLFGVGTLGSTFLNPDCGVLDRFSNDQCINLGAPWSCPSAGGITEAHTVTKSGPAAGGVLCVRDAGPPPCPSDYTIVRRWTATDDCDNVATATQAITVGDNTPPSIDPQAVNLTVECDGNGNAAQLDDWLAGNGGASASDACGGVTWNDDFTALSDGCGDTGSAFVTFTATDECGNASTTRATFTIADTTGPSIDVMASDATVECDGNGNTAQLGAWLAGSGGASASDICGSVAWSSDFTALSDDCGATGSALVTFTVTDECGNTSMTAATFTIVDSTPPVLTPRAGDAYCLWPPNHRYVCFTAGELNADFGPTASDICSGSAAWSIVGCASNQPDDDTGDGNTDDDCVVSPDGSQICMRAERDGGDPNGRTYSVLVAAVDACGLEGQAVAGTVHVPHDQSPRSRICRNAAHVGLRKHDDLPWVAAP
jgi:hypothetical protein